MSWTCINTEELLSDFLDGRLTAGDRAQVESHLAGCPSCSTLAAQLTSLAAQLRSLEPEPEPSGLVYRILEATSGAATAKRERNWKVLLAGLMTPRFALGLGSVVATLFILFQALG